MWLQVPLRPTIMPLTAKCAGRGIIVGKVKYAAWEVGPTWDMVEQWLKSYRDTTKRSIVISCGYHEHRSGASALWWSASSWSGGGRRAPEHYHETLFYWPNSRFVSLPAMVIGLITEHERETDALAAQFAKPYAPFECAELPLFKNHENS